MKGKLKNRKLMWLVIVELIGMFLILAYVVNKDYYMLGVIGLLFSIISMIAIVITNMKNNSSDNITTTKAPQEKRLIPVQTFFFWLLRRHVQPVME